jgi:quercetin dioxygenase-like cupin family protein
VARIGNRTHLGRWSKGSWKNLEAQDAQKILEQQVIAFDRLTVVRCVYKEKTDFPEHFHPQEQITIVEKGELEFAFGDETVRVGEGETISIEPQVRHATRVGNDCEKAVALNLFLTMRTPQGRLANGTGVQTVVRPGR